MILRKTNAVLSLLTTFLLFVHAIRLSAWMMSGGSVLVPSKIMPWVLAGLMVAHAAISIYQAIAAEADAEEVKIRQYPKQNSATMVQRATGILLVVLLALHVTSGSNHFQPKLLHAFVEPLFFAAAFAHVSVSLSKALITFGIGTAKVIKAVDVVMKIFCGAALVFGVVSLYIYLFAGVM